MKLSSTLLSFAACSALSLLPVVSADIYMHDPPGSNNRLDENTRNVDQANRLFDSQDNNRGGYLVPQQNGVRTPLKYFTGSKLPIQWTNQHACGGEQDNCDIIIQYMVGEANQANGVKALRDGTNRQAMPAGQDANPAYGRHEPQAYKDECRATLRNAGLFFADQAPTAAAGRGSTRQNAGGNANGNECAEERDYYPSWVPNPWRDVAIITNNVAKCDQFKALSQNVAATYRCVVAGNDKPITQAACQAKGGNWQTVAPKNLPPPECIKNLDTARDNSLGVVAGSNGTFANYLWTIPNDVAGKDFVVRIRYNISTGEYYDPVTGALEKGLNNIDSKYNSPTANGNAGAANAGVTTLAVGAALSIAGGEAAARNYQLKNNPQTDMFGPLLAKAGIIKTQEAVNLAQWGRTFEDRSHVLQGLDSSKDPIVSAALARGNQVLNIDVIGHGGNLAQVYPAVPLQFSQTQYAAKPGDVAVIQWSLSDQNPAANDDTPGAANGKDVANLVLLANPTYDRLNAIPASEGGNPFQCGAPGRSAPAAFESTATSLFGLDVPKLKEIATVSGKYWSGPIPLTNECVYAVTSTVSAPGTSTPVMKATIAVTGEKFAAFQKSAVVKMAQLRQAAAAEASLPAPYTFQAMTQLSTQTITPSNTNNALAKATIDNAFASTSGKSTKSTPIGMYIGIAAGVAVLLVLIVVAYVIYSKKLAASTSAQKAPQVYQVKASAPMATANGRSATPSRTGTQSTFKPVGMQQQQQSTQQMQQQQPAHVQGAQHKPTAQKQWQSDRARVQANYV